MPTETTIQPGPEIRHDLKQLETIEFQLAQLRDELRHRTFLARPGRDPWDRLEAKWQRLRSRVSALREAGDARDDAWESLHGLARELRDGYERLRAASPATAPDEF
jgi:hypothetical protein